MSPHALTTRCADSHPSASRWLRDSHGGLCGAWHLRRLCRSLAILMPGLGCRGSSAPPTAAHAPLLLRPHLLFYTRFPTPLLTPPLPLRTASAFFFVGCPATFSHPRLYLKPPPHFLHKVHTPLLLSAGSLRAFPHLRHVPPDCTPFPPHGHRHNGAFLPKTQKNEHRSLGSGARFGLLSGRHSAEWC